MSADGPTGLGIGVLATSFPRLRPAFACALAAALLCAAAAGCLKLEPTLTINTDGGGILHLRYELSSTAARQISLSGELAKQLDVAAGRTALATPAPSPLPIAEEQIRAALAPFEERGVHLNSLRVEKHREWHAVSLDIRFTNLADLMQLPFFTTCNRSLTRTKAGSYQFTFEAPVTYPGGAASAARDKNRFKELQPLLAGLKVAFTLNTPSDILDTDAHRKTRRTAAWEFDLDRNPDALDGLNGKKFSVVFTSVGAKPAEFSFPAKR